MYGCTWVVGREKYSLNRGQVGGGRCKIDDVWGVVRIKLLGVGSNRQEN